jgi:hypothetical protein
LKHHNHHWLKLLFRSRPFFICFSFSIARWYLWIRCQTNSRGLLYMYNILDKIQIRACTSYFPSYLLLLCNSCHLNILKYTRRTVFLDAKIVNNIFRRFALIANAIAFGSIVFREPFIKDGFSIHFFTTLRSVKILEVTKTYIFVPLQSIKTSKRRLIIIPSCSSTYLVALAQLAKYRSL